MRKDPEADDRSAALALLDVSRETLSDLDALVSDLRRWQAVKNLVGPGTLVHVWTRHIADSAQLLQAAPEALRWVDLGSGAGFPGLVIATILKDAPGAQVHLVEGNARKCAFLRETARKLDLPVTVHAGRIADVLRDWTVPVDVVCARALAPLPVLLGLAYPLLKTGALGVFPKGRDLGAELTDSARSWRIDASTVASRVDPEGTILVVRQAQPRT